MTQVQPAVAEPKKIVPVQLADTTYFLMVNDDYEKKAAKHYLSQLYPGTAARIVTDLRLDRLTDKHTVIALRRNDERTQAVSLRVDPQGIRVPMYTPVADLAREVQEAEPVRCVDYWTPAREGNEGELNLAGFLEQLGKKCIPAAIKFYPREGILRLGFA